MRDTKVLLLGIIVCFLTFLLIGLIVYLIVDYATYREAMRSPATFLICFSIGWAPAIVIAEDYDKYLRSKEPKSEES